MEVGSRRVSALHINEGALTRLLPTSIPKNFRSLPLNSVHLLKKLAYKNKGRAEKRGLCFCSSAFVFAHLSAPRDLFQTLAFA